MAKKTRTKFLHSIPVFTNAGECGWLVLWKKVPSKLLNALEEALPSDDNSFSEEEGLGLFFPDDLSDDGMDCIEKNHTGTVWCQDCLEGHPCDAWTVDFDKEGFMPRDPGSSQPEEKFNLKEWIARRKAEWSKYKDVYAEIRDIAGQFAEAVKQAQVPSATSAAMKAAEAAQVLGVEWPCDDEELKAAFKRAAMKAHPDREGGSAEKMKRVIAARDVLQGS